MPSRTGFVVVELLLLCCMMLGLSVADDREAERLIDKVDPFIGTGGNRYVCAHNTPGACVPFGVVRLSPDTVSTRGATAVNTSGYYFPDPLILGFSHTRLCGTGAVDGGHFQI